MKKIFKVLVLGVVPATLLVFGAAWYKKNSDASIEYQRNFEILKTACQESAAGKDTADNKTVNEYVNGICGCFAKAALHHKSVNVAGIVSDQTIVHSILKDCSKRTPASQ